MVKEREDLKAKVRAMYNAGYSTGEIAKTLNIAEYKVVRMLGILY